ncbi:unnamed protein product [Pleuronectes platessa]|uniref:Uncharacterized protein n=1 Tax=Pleuronectes platessa TaxID=8262 RepID=A0A9N7YFK7_PLEPL|nr:unnamed protein product [Pleuronectes platessa]
MQNKSKREQARDNPVKTEQGSGARKSVQSKQNRQGAGRRGVQGKGRQVTKEIRQSGNQESNAGKIGTNTLNDLAEDKGTRHADIEGRLMREVKTGASVGGAGEGIRGMRKPVSPALIQGSTVKVLEINQSITFEGGLSYQIRDFSQTAQMAK